MVWPATRKVRERCINHEQKRATTHFEGKRRPHVQREPKEVDALKNKGVIDNYPTSNDLSHEDHYEG